MKDIKTLKTMFHQLMTILSHKQRVHMLGMFIIILIGSFLELLGVSAMMPFVQALLSPDELMQKSYIQFFMRIFGANDNRSLLLMVGIGIVVIYIIKNIYLAISSYLQVTYSHNTKRQLAVLMLKSFMDRPYSFFVENGSGVILRGVGDDMLGVYNIIFNLFKMGVEGFVVVVIAIYLIITDPILAAGVLIIGLLCMVVIVFGVKKMLTRMSIAFRDATKELGKYVMQINSGIKDIIVFNRRQMFIDGYNKEYENANVAGIKYEFSGLVPERIIEAGCISGMIIMVLVRLHMGVSAEEFIPKMAVFAMSAFRILPSISRLTGNIGALIYGRPMLEATYENYMIAQEHTKRQQQLVVHEEDTEDRTFEKEIEIRDIDWRYPKGKSKVLEHFNLTIKKGEAIGIVGESGSGKSTLADILLRLYEPQNGEIIMDGIDVSSIPNTWTRVLAYVPQSVFLMDDTIRANVVFGAKCSGDDEVWEALRKASLDMFVRGLPDGLNTMVGERGVKFSGGQRQRIAIARALFVKPQVMILDEATSALDNETEEAVMEAIDSLAGTMTLIIIAHRVTTLRNCDKIYEVTGGVAVERNKADVIGTSN